MTIVGLRPLGHRSHRTRFIVTTGCWVVAASALLVVLEAPASVGSVAAEFAFLAGLVTALVLTSQLLRRRVAIVVGRADLRIGDVRLDRDRLEVRVEGPPGGWPRRVRLRAGDSGADVRLAGTRWLVPWPGSGSGADTLVPRVLLAQLVADLTGTGPGTRRFGLVRSGLAWWPDLAPVLAAVAGIAVAGITAPPALATMLTVAGFSVGILALAVRGWPRPVLRQLTVDDTEVRYLNVYSGRTLLRQDRSAVTVERRRWIRPGFRSIPAVPCTGARITLGRTVLDVAFPEPARPGDKTPVMRRPRWMTEPQAGDGLVLTARYP
jgi:hypothetical protein